VAEARGLETATRGCSGVCGPRGAQQSRASEGSRVTVTPVLSEVPAPEPAGPMDPAIAVPPGWLEGATGEGTAGDAVDVLKILAKRDPRSSTATFMLWPWKCGPPCCLNLKNTRSCPARLHPQQPAGIWTRAGPRTPPSPSDLGFSPHPRDFFGRTFADRLAGSPLPLRLQVATAGP
jgi:hypothetical protein